MLRKETSRREQETTSISWAKATCQDLFIPVMAPAQLSRKPEGAQKVWSDLQLFTAPHLNQNTDRGITRRSKEKAMPEKEEVQKLVEDAGGKVEEFGPVLPDGSSYAMASFPLPKDHWVYQDNGFEPPPMPLRMGTSNPLRLPLQHALELAARYAVRAATMKGRDMDFDPDALVQNLITGMLGYATPTSLGDDIWANP